MFAPPRPQMPRRLHFLWILALCVGMAGVATLLSLYPSHPWWQALGFDARRLIQSATEGTESYTVTWGIDWRISFLTACRQFRNGTSPYGMPILGFFNPPWILPLLLPLSFLRESLAVPLLYAGNLFTFAWLALRFGMRGWLVPFYLLLGGSMLNAYFGNVEFLPALGLVAPPSLGLLLVLLKPQIGAPVAAFWTVEAWRIGGWTRVVRIWAPFLAAFAVSWALYGDWFRHGASAANLVWNTAPWPWGIPLGVALLLVAMGRRDLRWALLSIPFLTPYLSRITWAFPLLGLLTLDGRAEFDALRRTLRRLRAG